jgi:serine/threonine protein kinase
MSSQICSLVPNDFLNNVIVIRELGRGTYGTVSLVEKPGYGQYAVKYMKIYSRNFEIGVPQSTLLDADALVRLRPVSEVINLVGICYLNDRVAIIMEPMDSNLRKFARDNNLDERITLTPRLLRVFAKCAALFEGLNITHFDIKPDNVLVRGSGLFTQFKVTDFGLARAVFGPNVVPTNELYTIWYRPPEFLSGRDRTTFNIYAGDIWAIAVTVVEFMIGQPLFPSTDVNYLLSLIRRASDSTLSQADFIEASRTGTLTGNILVRPLLERYIPPYQIDRIDPAIIEILTQMLSLDPNRRPTGAQIYEAFGQRINMEFLLSLLPPPFSRRIHAPSIELINQLSQQLRVSKASNLIAIEIFTRYLDQIEDLASQTSSGLDQIEDLRALAALRIAITFTETNPPNTGRIANAYRLLTQRNVKNVEIAQAEKEILGRIGFLIYNLNLTPVIQRAYRRNINLLTVNPNQFAEPLARWLID